MSRLNYARDRMREGMGYAAAARASGMNEIDLRKLTGAPTQDRAPPATSPRPTPKTRLGPVRITTHPIMAHDVALYVAAAHGRTFSDLCSQRRTRCYVRPRQIAMYCIRQLCPHMSYPEIGRRLGGRDHTTILHGVRKIGELMAVDPNIVMAVSDTLSHFRQQTPETPCSSDPILFGALSWRSLCTQYGQAMRAAA